MPVDDQGADGATPSTILVVEPDILVRMVIASYLRDCGYRVLERVTATDVMTLLGSGQKVDVVLSEARLRGRVDGFALARWIRGHYSDVDVISTSGATRAADRRATFVTMARSKNLIIRRKLFDASTSFANDGEQRLRLDGRAEWLEQVRQHRLQSRQARPSLQGPGLRINCRVEPRGPLCRFARNGPI
jgi:CheY-like chemotaxis protein